jgi:hypothetical protein
MLILLFRFFPDFVENIAEKFKFFKIKRSEKIREQGGEEGEENLPLYNDYDDDDRKKY